MQNRFDEFIEILKALEKEDVEYALIGGVALILYGMNRVTQDVDIFIDPGETNVKKLRKALSSIYRDAEIEEITADEISKYQVIRYGTPDGFYIDIMSSIGTAFSFEDISYQIINYEDIKIKTATPDTLYKLKKDTPRDRDKYDTFFLSELMKKLKKNN